MARLCRPRPSLPPSTPRPRHQPLPPRPPSLPCTGPASDGQWRRTRINPSRSRCRASPQPPRTFRRNIFPPTTRSPSSWARIPSPPTHSLTIPASFRTSSRKTRNSPSAICSKTGTAPATWSQTSAPVSYTWNICRQKKPRTTSRRREAGPPKGSPPSRRPPHPGKGPGLRLWTFPSQVQTIRKIDHHMYLKHISVIRI